MNISSNHRELLNVLNIICGTKWDGKLETFFEESLAAIKMAMEENAFDNKETDKYCCK